MPPGGNIDVIVYVTGAPCPVTVNPNQKIEQLIREALKKAGKHGADPAGWALRLPGGGDPLDPGRRVGEAGITDGMELSLDRDEGGGGNAPAPFSVAPAPPPLLVAPEVSRAKLARQLDAFNANAASYRRRGIVLLEHEDLTVDVGFQCRLPTGEAPDLVAMPLAVRFEFTNYDVWAPSLDFIDPITHELLPHPPVIRGLAFRQDGAPIRGGPVDVFVDNHPETTRTFVCKRGVREYHSHFEHNGDDWLLYRGDDLGTLAQLVEVLWRHTTRTVTGLHFIAQRFAIGNAIVAASKIELRRDDVDALAEQLAPQLAQAQQMAMMQQAVAQQG
jgi:Predicted metal binding domain/WXG100 protein secretion system (Wss), protein YukD